MPHATINAATRIGVAAILNTGSIVEHDCYLEDGVHVSSNATLAGGVRVGKLSWIGAGAIVIQGVRVGRSATVGAGAVVIRNVADDATVVGCPASPLDHAP
jgi:acetyltransferase-like isoleucine patch superfamily enzyme